MNNSSAYCIEYFYAKPDSRQQLLQALRTLVEKSRAEPSCQQYDLLQDQNNQNLFILIVKFATTEAMRKHENQPYVTDFEKNRMNQLCEKVLWHDAITVIPITNDFSAF